MNPSGDISITLITTDRFPRKNYLSETINNLVRGGVFESERLNLVHLLPSSERDTHWKIVYSWIVDERRPINIHVPHTSLLPCENAGRALQIGSQDKSKWVLFLEDDIDVCADFLDSVGKWLDRFGDNPDYRIFQFGCPYTPQVYLSHPPIWEYHSYYDFYGTQCFAIRSEDAESLGKYIFSNAEFVRPNPSYNPLIPDEDASPFLYRRNPAQYDLMFCQWAEINYPNCRFVASVPSFVQHIGEESSLTDSVSCHKFPSWPGRDWRYEK